MDADPPGANDWDCKPTAQHPRPVVLVHGTAGNKNTNWQTYAPLLANNGYCVFALTYGVSAGTPKGLDQFGGLDEIETSAQQLKDVRRQGAPVHRCSPGRHPRPLAGHPDAELLREVPRRRAVHPQLRLAGARSGTAPTSERQGQMSQSMSVYAPSSTETPGCPACSEMSTDSAFMQKMRAGGVAVKGISYTNIVTKYDELVSPYTSGIEPGMRNITVQDGCATDYTEHFEIASDPVAAGYVLNALDPAHPRPVPCTVVLPFEGPVPARPDRLARRGAVAQSVRAEDS